MTRLLAGALLVTALSLAIGCRGGKPDWRITQLYGGPGSVQALTAPVSVDAFRIEPVARGAEPGVAFVGVHEVTAGPVALSPEQSKALSTILANPDTYDWRRAKSDPYAPTIGIRFSRDVSRVDLAFDFTSNMLTIHRHGKRIGVEDFDNARPALLALVKTLFATDPDVQALE